MVSVRRPGPFPSPYSASCTARLIATSYLGLLVSRRTLPSHSGQYGPPEGREYACGHIWTVEWPGDCDHGLQGRKRPRPSARAYMEAVCMQVGNGIVQGISPPASAQRGARSATHGSSASRAGAHPPGAESCECQPLHTRGAGAGGWRESMPSHGMPSIPLRSSLTPHPLPLGGQAAPPSEASPWKRGC